jgi:hypothetical protein
VQDEVDRLAVVLDGQFLELFECPGERVAVVELNGAVQRDRLLRTYRELWLQQPRRQNLCAS